MALTVVALQGYATSDLNIVSIFNKQISIKSQFFPGTFLEMI